MAEHEKKDNSYSFGDVLDAGIEDAISEEEFEKALLEEGDDAYTIIGGEVPDSYEEQQNAYFTSVIKDCMPNLMLVIIAPEAESTKISNTEYTIEGITVNVKDTGMELYISSFDMYLNGSMCRSAFIPVIHKVIDDMVENNRVETLAADGDPELVNIATKKVIEVNKSKGLDIYMTNEAHATENVKKDEYQLPKTPAIKGSPLSFD